MRGWGGASPEHVGTVDTLIGGGSLPDGEDLSAADGEEIAWALSDLAGAVAEDHLLVITIDDADRLFGVEARIVGAMIAKAGEGRIAWFLTSTGPLEASAGWPASLPVVVLEALRSHSESADEKAQPGSSEVVKPRDTESSWSSDGEAASTHNAAPSAPQRKHRTGSKETPDLGSQRPILRLGDLTAAQRAVAVLAGAGHRRSGIVKCLTAGSGHRVSPKTVDAHIRAIAAHLPTGSGSGFDRVVEWAARQRGIDPDPGNA
jgi:hypothetical protein